MMMIVLVHANYYSLGSPSKSDMFDNPILSFWRVFAEQLCISGVDIFILISGWFGIKPSANGICALLFQVFFWGILLMGFGYAIGLEVPLRPSLKVLFLGSYYWFIPAYVGLYAFSPVLNSFIEHATPTRIRTVLIAFFTIQFTYGWITNTGSYLNGYSFISFIGLYLLARYLNQVRHTICSLPAWGYFSLFLISTLIPALISFLGIRNNWPVFSPLHYSSPFVILAAVSLLLGFSKITIKSKSINLIAISVFSTYLFHMHPVVEPLFKSTMCHLSIKLSALSYSLTAIGIAGSMVVICALVDKIRMFFWGPLHNVCFRVFLNKEGSNYA